MGSKVAALAALVLLASGATFAKGVDVSNYQGSSIDWPQVAAAGYTFAFAKASEGTTFTDATYASNRTGTRSAGLLLGAYHFARPAGTNDATIAASAIAQADHFVDVAQPRAVDPLPTGAPAPATQPTVLGTARAGAKLAAVPGTWSGGKPVSFVYQWQRCDAGAVNCVPLPGATLETYTPGNADIGHVLVVSV